MIRMKKGNGRIPRAEISDLRYGNGSGFFVSNDGLFVTNYHVIERASSAVTKTASGDHLSLTYCVEFGDPLRGKFLFCLNHGWPRRI
jgi:hypothetical protein